MTTAGAVVGAYDAGASNDAGFAADAGEHGTIIDGSSQSDAGAHEEEQIAAQVTVRIVGAKMLPPEIYLEVLQLPSSAKPTAATAERVKHQLLDYLARMGFLLASVAVVIERDEIVVHLNEGQVNRVLYLGQLSFQQVRFKLAFSLPSEVFNRPSIDRQVRELSAEMGLTGVTWELVHLSEVEHLGPQIDELPASFDIAMQGAAMVHQRRPYELRIRFASKGPGTGLGLLIRITKMDGVETGVGNTWGELLAPNDRLTIFGSGGFGIRSNLTTERLYGSFSKGTMRVRYDLPPLLERFRPNLWVENEWLARQRADLNLENYWAVTVDAAAQLQVEFSKGLHLVAGAGVEWRKLFGFLAQPEFVLPEEVQKIQNVDRVRPLLRATVEWVIDPDILRWDRRHVLEVEARQLLPVQSGPGLGWLDVRYRFVKELGWHDFWVKSSGRLAWGEVTFHDELSLGHFTRGLFSDQFVPSAVNLSLEFRFSLTRDVLKLSLFHDLVLFAVPDRSAGSVSVQLANSFGPGLHVLLHDMFQFDLYMAFGFRRNAQFGAAFNLQFQKAF